MESGSGRYCLSCKGGVSSNSLRRKKKEENPKETFVNFTKNEVNKIRSFVENPEKYATGSEKTSSKIDELMIISQKLCESDLAVFNSSLEKYNIALAEVKKGNRSCPRCGSKMYLRNGKYGQFYGCVRYPYCKGTMKL